MFALYVVPLASLAIITAHVVAGWMGRTRIGW